MTVTSARYGTFDPLAPEQLDGPFAFTVHAPPVMIGAPVEQVWSVLTDFDGYAEWCPFTRRIDARLAIGEPVRLHLNWKVPSLGSPQQVQVEEITILDAPHALGWAATLMAGAIRAERTQFLEPVEGGTRYHTFDRFAGPLVPLVRLTFGHRIERGFTAVGEALAERVEEVSK